MALYEDRTYRIASGGERIDGVCLTAFIHNGNYFLTKIRVYQDGIIDCWEWVDFEGFKRKVRSGWVVTQLPPDAEVNVYPLGSFRATHVMYEIAPEEFIKEVSDVIEVLNGRPMTGDRCRDAWAAYQASPNDATREVLRVAYEAIPRHNRDYVLGNMDTNDRPIRRVLYPDVERCRSAWAAYESYPDSAHKAVLRATYEALPEDKRIDAVSNRHLNDLPIRRVLYPSS